MIDAAGVNGVIQLPESLKVLDQLVIRKNFQFAGKGMSNMLSSNAISLCAKMTFLVANVDSRSESYGNSGCLR